MSKELAKIGLSPYAIRLAARYAVLGLGMYHPKGAAWFDEVKVCIATPWTPNEQLSLSGMVLRVEFHVEGMCTKSVDFIVQLAGWSGDPVLKSVK